MTRKICFVTGNRAEYGLLRFLMALVKMDPDLVLQIVVTGMHLSAEFGHTYSSIEEDGFLIDRKLEILLSSDSEVGITKSMGLGLIGFADIFSELHPDLIVVLGDRFEILSAAMAALLSRIPVAHLHGGEATEGLIDEAIRHSITKMSQFHFVAADEYARRVIQLGEQPSNVFLVGGLGVDVINRTALMTRAVLEEDLNFKFFSRMDCNKEEQKYFLFASTFIRSFIRGILLGFQLESEVNMESRDNKGENEFSFAIITKEN